MVGRNVSLAVCLGLVGALVLGSCGSDGGGGSGARLILGILDELPIVRTDGTGLRNISNATYPLKVASWSNDGSRIVYVKEITPGSNRIYLYDEPSDGTSIVKDGVDGDWAFFSPDDTEVFFEESGTIRRMGTDGTGEASLVTPTGGYVVRMFLLSPDGSSILSYEVGSTDRMVVYDIDGLNPNVVLDSNWDYYNFAWSPDSTEFYITYLLNGDANQKKALVVDVATGGTVDIYPGLQTAWPLGITDAFFMFWGGMAYQNMLAPMDGTFRDPSDGTSGSTFTPFAGFSSMGFGADGFLYDVDWAGTGNAVKIVE